MWQNAADIEIVINVFGSNESLSFRDDVLCF